VGHQIAKPTEINFVQTPVAPASSQGLPAATFDLDAYLRRIGWSGPLDPTLATLTRLMGAHTGSVPFENLDVLLGRPIRLDLAHLQQKIVAGRRGGYCFEHATLFRAALDAIGFRPSSHAARVVLDVVRDAAPRTHMFLTVPLPEGTFVLDPGFGNGPRVPVPLDDGGVARHGTEAHVMRRAGHEWVLTAESTGARAPQWHSTLEHECAIDFVMGNHFTSTFPASRFVNNLLLRALTPDGRVSVLNRDVRIVRGDEVVQRPLADRAELRALLVEHFGFDLPEVERLRVPAVPEWT
jgi:N-hydroxyarylamine O-acetyltransferase